MDDLERPLLVWPMADMPCPLWRDDRLDSPADEPSDFERPPFELPCARGDLSA